MQADQALFLPHLAELPATVGDVPKKKSPQTYDEHLGRVIGALAEEQGKTQAQVAAAAGMNLTTYGRRERGETAFTAAEVERIAHYLGESPGYILQRALTNFGGIEKMLSEATSKKAEQLAGEDDLGAVPILSRRQSEAVKPEKKAARRGSKEDQE